jgi:hypothetical protein
MGVQLVGYDAIPFPSDRLAAFFQQITALSLPLAPDMSGYGGCDGTMNELAVFGDLWSSWRFRWWSEFPEQWRPLVAIASEMIESFPSRE